MRTRKFFTMILSVSLCMGTAQLALALFHKKTPPLPQSSPISVNVVAVRKTTLSKEVMAIGTLVATRFVTISSEVNGRIAKIFFKDGQAVAKGMPIVKLDDAAAKANYESAVTTLNLSKTKYQRALTLATQGAISQEDLETLKAAVESNQASGKRSLGVLKQKEILAPFSGVLGAFKVQVGDYISSGDPLVSLVNLDEIKVEYALPERFLPMLKTNQQVVVKTSAYPHQSFYGTVTYISPTVDKVTRSIAVQVIIDNKQHLLSPGLFVHVKQLLAQQKGALVIPEEAVIASIKGYQVYRVVKHRAVLTTVTIGARKGGDVQILKGLRVGDIVVTEGQQKLRDGSWVSPNKGLPGNSL